MKIFSALRRFRALQRNRLPFLKTIVDLDLVIEISHAQESGDPITLKQLFIAQIGPAATVQRRLARLKKQGVVQQVRSDRDRRVVQLIVRPDVVRSFKKLAYLSREEGEAHPAKRAHERDEMAARQPEEVGSS